MTHSVQLIPWTGVFVLLLSPICDSLDAQEAAATAAPPANVAQNDGRFNSVAYVQNAAEFRLVCQQTYHLALLRLTEGVRDLRWTADEVQLVDSDFESKPPAVIMDVDETVLDNSAFNARNILAGRSYDGDVWNAWCQESKAGKIAGALEFVLAAKRLGVEVFFITNRRDEVKEATLENLQRHGFPVTERTLMTQNPKDNRDGRKTTRRAAVAKDYRIVLLIGDNMSDMCTGVEVRDTEERNAVAKTKTSVLGSRWILLPNPVYGAWERALPKGACGSPRLVDSRGIIKNPLRRPLCQRNQSESDALSLKSSSVML